MPLKEEAIITIKELFRAIFAKIFTIATFP